MQLEQALILSEDLKEIKAASGSNAKKELARSWDTPAHKEFIDLVGNNKRQWFITWGTVTAASPLGEGMEFDDILFAAENRLCTPSCTAGRFCDLLEDGWPKNVLTAIVDKKLDAGVTISTLKKVLGERKVFQPALCADWLKFSDKKRLKVLSERNYYSTPKMDGLRCIIKVNTPDRGVYSKSLKPIYNMDGILADLEATIPFPCHVDGEAFAADNTWNSSMTGAKKKGSKVKMVFYPFDLILRSEIDSTRYTMPAEARWALMEDSIVYDEDTICYVARRPVSTISEVEEQYELDIADGWEGSVLHDASAPYACKRSDSWIKVKKFFSSEFTIIGMEAGEGKHFGRLGAIVIEGVASDNKYTDEPITCEVGTGFTDSERQEMWENPDDYIGRTAEIKYFEVTFDNRKSVASLRFTSFLRMRDEE